MYPSFESYGVDCTASLFYVVPIVVHLHCCMEDDDSDILSHQIHDNSSTTVLSFMQHHNHVLPSCAPERKGQPKVQSVCFKADRPTSIKP